MKEGKAGGRVSRKGVGVHGDLFGPRVKRKFSRNLSHNCLGNRVRYPRDYSRQNPRGILIVVR